MCIAAEIQTLDFSMTLNDILLLQLDTDKQFTFG